MLCPRKWAWEKIEKLERSESEATKRGQRCHKVWEAYLEHGTDPRAAVEAIYPDLPPKKKTEIVSICKATLPLLPLPEVGEVEGYFEFSLTVDDVPVSVRGYIDWALTDQTGHEEAQLGKPPSPGRPYVIDHKSTKDIDAYAADLSVDVQGVIYTVRALIKNRSADAVDLAWMYSQTSGPRRGEAVRYTMTRAEAETRFGEVVEVIREIIRARALAEEQGVLALTPNPSACGAFGGCPHKGRCVDVDLDPLGDLFADHEGEQSVNLLEELEAMERKSTDAEAGLLSPDAPALEPDEVKPAPTTKAKTKAKPKEEPAPDEPHPEPRPKAKAKVDAPAPTADAPAPTSVDLTEDVRTLAKRALEQGEDKLAMDLISAILFRRK